MKTKIKIKNDCFDCSVNNVHSSLEIYVRLFLIWTGTSTPVIDLICCQKKYAEFVISISTNLINKQKNVQ